MATRTQNEQRAIEAYRKHLSAAMELLHDIGEDIIAKDNATPHKDWGHVADIGRHVTNLRDIRDCLRGEGEYAL